MNKEEMKLISIHVDLKTWTELGEYCQINGMKKAFLVNKIIKEWLINESVATSN